MLPQIFMGGQKGFRLMSPESLGGFWQQETLGRTLAIFDWNRDGRMDVVGNHLDVPAVVLENQSSGADIMWRLS